jgi:hypothetical protein
MRRPAVVLFAVVACAAGHAVQAAGASSDFGEWQTAAGKALSKNEFAAVLAACEDKAKSASKTESVEDCFTAYGLRRAQ